MNSTVRQSESVTFSCRGFTLLVHHLESDKMLFFRGHGGCRRSGRAAGLNASAGRRRAHGLIGILDRVAKPAVWGIAHDWLLVWVCGPCFFAASRSLSIFAEGFLKALFSKM